MMEKMTKAESNPKNNLSTEHETLMKIKSERRHSKRRRVMTQRRSGGVGREVRGQGAYAGRAIPMIGLPVLGPVERRGAQAGTRGQGGDGGRVGLVGLGQRRPRGRAVLLRIRQRTTAQDSVTHGATALARSLWAAAICCRVRQRAAGRWRGVGRGEGSRG